MYGYKAKKNFGQNFLTNPKTIARIVEKIVEESSESAKPNSFAKSNNLAQPAESNESNDFAKSDEHINSAKSNKKPKSNKETKYHKYPQHIVEIGPGLGAFTKPLVATGIPVTAIEIDKDLIPFLQAQIPNVRLINEDFLKLDLSSLKLPKNTVFYGSLPYNISKKIIRKLIEWEDFSRGFFIIQKEVADKYIATAPNSNKLAALSQIYAIPKKHFEISKGQFNPVPKVISTFIEFQKRDEKLDESLDVSKIESIINMAFISPRKTLKNNLRGSYPKITGTSFSKVAAKRPSELSLENYIHLLKELTS